MKPVALGGALALLGLGSLPAQMMPTPVDLELSLVTDVSGSVSLSEYQLMMNGYENAFRSPSLIGAIESGPIGSVAVNLVFFANNASEGIPFQLITNSTDANAFADSIASLSGSKPDSGGTNIGSGIDLAASLLAGNTYDGRSVIDVAGDGTGSSPGSSRDNALNGGVDTINGIVIGTDPDGSLAQFYEDEVIGGSNAFVAVAPTFEDFRPEIEAKIEREIRGGPVLSDTARLTASTLRSGSIGVARTATRDVGGRLARMRAGVRNEPVVTTQPAPYSAKGGMPKGGMAKEPLVLTENCPWQVWGQIYYTSQDLDEQLAAVNVPGANFRQVVQPDTSIDTFGGTVGLEYAINPSWTIGFAIGGTTSEADMRLVGDVDIDALTLMPYISYYRPIGATMAVYADLLYGYGSTDYETYRLPGGARGDTDGHYHALEFNTGLNMNHAGVVHGPFAQLRWLDGEIDGYTETGPGAVVFPEADFESLASQLGYQASYPVELGGGTLVPQGWLAWEHEFEEDQGNLAGLPLGTLDEDLAVLGAGIAYYRNCCWNLGLDYEARLGDETQSHFVGLRGGLQF